MFLYLLTFLKIYAKQQKKDFKLPKFEEKITKKTAKIEQITQTFIAICHFSLRSRNLRPIAFEPQDSKDHFRYLTFWERIFKIFFLRSFFLSFFSPTSEKRWSWTSSQSWAGQLASLAPDSTLTWSSTWTFFTRRRKE